MRRQDLVFIILILCTWCALSTELLSALHSITFSGVLLVWIPPAVAGGWYLFKRFPPPKNFFRRFTSHWIPPFLLLVLVFSLLIGILYPPNNFDSMTYHMGRVGHWIQNKSIAFYPTHIGRQLNYQPFSEWIILHVQILTGGDRLANTIQLWFFAGCIAVVTMIIQELGGSRRAQLLGAFLTGMIPMAIAQSNTTQNDVVGAYFVLCFAWCTLVLQRRHTICMVVFAGISLGLAWLTKGTAYIFTLPFILWYLLPLIKRSPVQQRVRLAVQFTLIPLIVLTLNAGYYYRNFSATGSPLGDASSDLSNKGSAPVALALVGVKDVLNHIPIGDEMRGRLMNSVKRAGIDIDDPRYNFGPTAWMATHFMYHEDYAQNFAHTLLLIVFSVYFFTRTGLYTRRPDRYTLYVLSLFASVGLFVSLLKWQPWHNRLETPLFMLFCVCLGLSIDKLHAWIRAAIILFVAYFGLPFLVRVERHPVLPIENSILYKSYDSFIYSDQLVACGRYLDGKPYTQLGIVIGGDSWDYPYYKLLGKKRVLEHVLVENKSAVYDKGFVPEAIIGIDTSRMEYNYKGRNYSRSQVFGPTLAVYEQR